MKRGGTLKESYRIRRSVEKRLNDLEGLVIKKHEQLMHAPEGRLRSTQMHGKERYYQYLPGESGKGIYLPESKMDLAQALAQKSYDERILAAAEGEMKALQKYLGSVPSVMVEDIFESYSDSRQKMIVPIMETDEQFLQRWLNQPSPNVKGRREHPVVITDQGKEVDSKAELVLSMQFDKKNVPFLQQWPIVLKNGRVIYADFKVLNLRTRREFLWEHLGMLGSEEYCRHSLPRLNELIMNGFIPGVNLILTWESEACKLDLRVINTLINTYLM